LDEEYRDPEMECVIELANGGSIRCPAYPDDVDYVRVCDAKGDEIAYWSVDEWAEEPGLVMGAFLGCAYMPTQIVRKETSPPPWETS
jgi:hypothetical protein